MLGRVASDHAWSLFAAICSQYEECLGSASIAHTGRVAPSANILEA